jgi:hypothetical protein
MKEVAGWQKRTGKPRQQRKVANSSKTAYNFPGGKEERKLKTPSQDKIGSLDNRLAIPTPPTSLEPSQGFVRQ